MNVVSEPDEVAARLSGEIPPVVADVRWTLSTGSQHADYLAGHLPGAQFVDLERDLSAADGEPDEGHRSGGRHPLPDPARFQQAMRRIGVSNQRPVVIYDDAAALPAARLWWMLVDAGKRDVTVLNGGYRAWIDAGYDPETGSPAPVRPGDFDAAPGQLPAVDGDQLAAMITAGRAPMIIDVRAADRYSGSTEPMDATAGHIPGAINVPSMINISPDGRFMAAADIAARYPEPAGDDQQPVIYCGSGITAAHTLLSRAAAGLPVAALYPGSWSDWITDPQRPVATGDQP